MNPVQLSIFANRLSGVCDEMGAVLRLSALSPNIKDRLDFSCAIFDAQGRLCAQAAHIPVHLGSMAYAMADLVSDRDWQPGDLLVVNDPYMGGTHLPDVTVVAPVFGAASLIGFAVTRAHHANIGAHSPGSMPVSTRLDQEGIVIAPSWLKRGGQWQVPLCRELARLDFSGTADQVAGNINCPLSVAAAAAYYCFRCLMDDDVPACDGLFRPISLSAPQGSLLNANRPAAVAAGNVETSSRVVDVVLGALAQAAPEAIPAASQGTMNNVAMGAAGENGWDYYETMAGGTGAHARGPGLSAVHSHMTNTLNTPIESLESHYPLRVHRYQVRRGSGGDGQFVGGDGLVRELEFLGDAQVTLLTERRRHAPWGLAGGQLGAVGENRHNGELLPPKTSFTARAGDRLLVASPGGGGYCDTKCK